MEPVSETRRAGLLPSLLGVLLALAGSVHAEAPAATAPELLLFEEPVVSAAAKHPQRAREAPSSVTVLTRDDIRRFGWRTLAEALRSVRGFYGSYDRNYSYVGVRGFLRPGDYNDRILLLVNGHTYNDDIYQTALLGPEFGIDLEAVERIEVVRGPGSALYGGNALFAVINVVTSTAAQQPGIRPLVETGSYGRKRGQLSVGHVFENGLEVFTSGSVLDVDGHDDLFYRAYARPKTNFGFADDADGERALNYFLSARDGPFSFQGGINRRDKQIPTAAFASTFDDPGTKTTDGRQFAELTYAAPVAPNVDVTARTFYDGVWYHGTYISGAGPTRLKNEDFAPSNWFGSELRARWAATADHSLTAGGEFTYHPDAVQRNFNLPTRVYFLNDHRSYDTWGLYAEDEWTVLPTVTIVGGLRFDSWYDRLQEVSPRLAGIWTPTPDTDVKLLIGRAFRPPNLAEQFYATYTGVRNLANPGLDSERILTYEADVEQRLWWGTTGTVALYRYDIDGLIDLVRVSAPGVRPETLQYQNLNTVTANGAEFELLVPLPHRSSIRQSVAMQETRTDDGRLLSNSPKFLSDTSALFPLPWGLEAGAELLVVGPRLTLTRGHIGSTPILNATVRYPTPVRDLVFSAGVYNLLDYTYFDPAGPEHRMDRIEQDGITFRLQAQYAF